jgi:hypothetical protein
LRHNHVAQRPRVEGQVAEAKETARNQLLAHTNHTRKCETHKEMRNTQGNGVGGHWTPLLAFRTSAEGEQWGAVPRNTQGNSSTQGIAKHSTQLSIQQSNNPTSDNPTLNHFNNSTIQQVDVKSTTNGLAPHHPPHTNNAGKNL